MKTRLFGKDGSTLWVGSFLIVLFSFAESYSNDIPPRANSFTTSRARQVPKPTHSRVSWGVLRKMAATGQNPAVVALLKKHNQQIRKSSGTARKDSKSLATNSIGNCSDEDNWNPDDECNPQYPDDGEGLESVRIDLPFMVNGNQLYITVTTVYDRRVNQVVSTGAAIRGNGAPQSWSNYATPVAQFDGTRLQFVGNISYSYSTGQEIQIGAIIGAEVTIPSVTISVGMDASSTNSATTSYNGVIWINAEVNSTTGFGTGMVQINGSSGPRYNYKFAPAK